MNNWSSGTLGTGALLGIMAMVSAGAQSARLEGRPEGWLETQSPDTSHLDKFATVVIDKRHSQIDVLVQATAHSFVAKLTEYQLTVGADAKSGAINAVELNFRFADVTTENRARDRELQLWQQTETFPEVHFSLSKLTPASEGGYLARGRLRWHGTTRDVSFPVSIVADGKLYSIDGLASLDTRAFGLPIIRKLGLLRVDPNVKVRFHLQGSVKLNDVSGLASGKPAARE